MYPTYEEPAVNLRSANHRWGSYNHQLHAASVTAPCVVTPAGYHGDRQAYIMNAIWLTSVVVHR